MVALLFAGAFSLAFTLFLTPLFIKLFHRLQWGQFIRDDGPQTHHTKRGTATMGGIVIILASVLGYFVGHLLTWDGIRFDPVTPSGLLVVFMMVGLGFVGFLDDYLKTRKQQSLGLGGALAALAILSRTELLLVFIGGLFVIVAGSVILQRIYFKLTKGKRIFLMSPLHHHFELKGWAEVTVVVRFWIIAGLLVAAGVGTFYLEWITQ